MNNPLMYLWEVYINKNYSPLNPTHVANILSVTTFTGYDGSTESVVVSPSVNMLISVFNIQDVRTYTPSPVISGVNTMLTVTYHDGNSERLGTLLINESKAAILAAGNAPLA